VVYGLGFRDWSLSLGWGLGFRFYGLGFKVLDLGFRV
jgi:hypothetical protein